MERIRLNRHLDWVIWGVISVIAGVYNYLFYRFSISPDDWFNLNIGRYIVEHRAFPVLDQFTWLGVEKQLQMTNYQWLYQVLLYASHRLAGWTAENIAISVLATMTYLLLFFYVRQRSGSRRVALMVGTSVIFVGLFLDTLTIFPRPQSLIIFLILLQLIILESGRRRWLLIPVFMLALNIHAGMWPILVMVSLPYVISRPRLWWAAGLPVLLLLLTPGPLANFLLPFRFAAAQRGIDFIAEWRPFWISLGSSWEIGLAAAVFGFMLFLIILNLRRRCYFESVLFIFYLLLWCTALRYLVLPVFFAIPYLSSNLSTLLSRPPVRRMFIYLPSMMAFLMLLNCFYILLPRNQNILRHSDLAVEGTAYAPGIITYMRKHSIDRYYNESFSVGGWLSYNGLPPMYDNRTEIYLPDANSRRYDYLSEMASNLKDRSGTIRFLRSYGIRYVLTDNSENIFQPNGYLERDTTRILYREGSYMLLEIER